jgi:hypothetical protein
MHIIGGFPFFVYLAVLNTALHKQTFFVFLFSCIRLIQGQVGYSSAHSNTMLTNGGFPFFMYSDDPTTGGLF